MIQSVYCLTQIRHSCGQKRGQRNDLGIRIFTVALNNLCNGNIDSQVDDLKACALDHHGNQVLSDIMQVILNRSDNYLAQASCGAICKMRLQNCNALFHGAGRYQHLGYKDFIFGELLSNLGHRLYHTLIQDFRSITTCIQSSLYCLCYLLRASFNNKFLYFFNFRSHNQSFLLFSYFFGTPKRSSLYASMYDIQ